MVDVNVVSEKLKQLLLHIEKIRSNTPSDPSDLAAGSNALDLVSFNLLIAVQTCLDLATHLIADEGWAPWATAREAFERLEEKEVISRETAQALRQAASLRNIIAHGYAGIDPARIHAAAKAGPADLERFAAELSTWMTERIK